MSFYIKGNYQDYEKWVNKAYRDTEKMTAKSILNFINSVCFSDDFAELRASEGINGVIDKIINQIEEEYDIKSKEFNKKDIDLKSQIDSSYEFIKTICNNDDILELNIRRQLDKFNEMNRTLTQEEKREIFMLKEYLKRLRKENKNE